MSFTEYSESKFNFPAKLWLPLEEVEHEALDQIRNVSRHPEIADSLAVMPDCHKGYGVTIGSVFLTEDSILPNAVGSDIGCGMSAIKTDLVLDDSMDEAYWRKWAAQVNRDIPTGFNRFDKEKSWSGLGETLKCASLDRLKDERAGYQIGSLGGGNHFLEAQFDENGSIWVMVHSGSRGIGKAIADHYHDEAIDESIARNLNTNTDLSSLSLHNSTAHDYIHDMEWAMRYAKESRKRMCDSMLKAFRQNIGVLERIDCFHNYAEVSGNRALHRKGATFAGLDSSGIIPGSMGSNSYIVKGKGNKDSMDSCSHGAGRTMSRGAAKRAITSIDQLEEALKGTFTKASFKQADEGPHAYKSIDEVISRQLDLVDITHILQPLITVKGGGPE